VLHRTITVLVMLGLCVVMLLFVLASAFTSFNWQSEVSLAVVLVACAIAGAAFSVRRYRTRR
jgi:hypothetical protein